jgi:hypothetical protein
MTRRAAPIRIPLPYWRAALAEQSLLHPEIPPESKSIAIEGGEGRWRVVGAEPDVATWVDNQFAVSKVRLDGKSGKTIPFVLIAARLSEAASHGVKHGAIGIHKGLTLLCVPCLLDRSGGLWPDPDRNPWVPRDVLEPTLKLVAIGALDSYDGFISKLPAKAASLDDSLRFASELFAVVTGSRLPLLPVDSDDIEVELPVFELEGYELVSQWHGLPYDPPIIPKHLIKLYDQIICDEPAVPLLDSLRTTTDRPSRAPPSIEDSERWHKKTLGHISNKDPLSPSQREAMVELVRLEAGEVLAVNGPPGTGKTMLLHSVVAQMWIDAALRESECPLIVVASTNVKAVENVMDSFAKVCAETKHQRWHPYVGGFGLFMASESRDSTYPTCTSKSHPFAEFETTDAVASAESFYLGRACAFFEREHESVQQVVQALHTLLEHFQKRVETIVSARYAVHRATGQSAAEGAASSCKGLLALHKAGIDTEQMMLRDAEGKVLSCNADAAAVENDHCRSRAAIDHAEQGWTVYLATSPLWLDLLSFLPPIRRRRVARDRHFLMSNTLTADRLHRDHGVEEHLNVLRKAAMEERSLALGSIGGRVAAAQADRAASLERRKAAEQAWSKIDKVFRRWQVAIGESGADMIDVALSGLNDQLDRALRAPMFCIADWYWSGKWLLEMKSRHAASERDSKGRVRLEAMYRRFAKLSPCLVSNFHMAPSFFTAWQGEDMPFWNTIDLLIVDEAGQVSPDVGAPIFALAKRALVVGDIHQIEPVWNNGQETDRVNAAKFGLIAAPHDARYDAIEAGGYSPASGSLMRIANRSCSVRKYDDTRGLLLTEHRRCVPELIGYCNELIYSGRLQPVRGSIEPSQRLLPAFGHSNVSGQDKPVGKSRRNDEEASAIVSWLRANRARIEAHYRDDAGSTTPLWKLVGIVTPFKSQAGAIERALKRDMPDLLHKDGRLTVGTVHALQGAERAIVIFSPTYGSSFKGGAFFDRTPNMLNVAVSRAKDSFLVFGNLTLFDASKQSRPSGLLAKYLFHKDWSSSLDA